MRLIDADKLLKCIPPEELCSRIAVANAPTIEERKTGRWIPCSERLPEKERRTYWVCTDAETQHECRWTNNRFGMTELDEWGWSIFDTPQYTKVIAWMPLPEPWKGEEHE